MYEKRLRELEPVVPDLVPVYPKVSYPTPLEVLEGVKVVEDFKGKVDGGGYKRSFDDPRKIPLSLIDPEYQEGTARVLQHGAKKYAPGNWMRGMSWSGVIDAQKRHLAAIEKGEDRDPETGELHVYHIACCNMFLARFMSHEEYKQFDDRLFKAVTE